MGESPYLVSQLIWSCMNSNVLSRTIDRIKNEYERDSILWKKNICNALNSTLLRYKRFFEIKLLIGEIRYGHKRSRPKSRYKAEFGGTKPAQYRASGICP